MLIIAGYAKIVCKVVNFPAIILCQSEIPIERANINLAIVIVHRPNQVPVQIIQRVVLFAWASITPQIPFLSGKRFFGK